VSGVAEVLRALEFAAKKHASQRRKGGPDAAPYINHVIEVARLLADVGGVEDVATLQAAALHDTIEDTATSAAELTQTFGAEVTALVLELTDDKTLPKQERKRLQVVTASDRSDRAKRIKIADKVSNIREVAYAPPADWGLERRVAYLDWSEAVLAGCRGVCPPLERHFDRLLEECRARLGEAAPAAG
jgi:guanosine-3',5'-bis(diphosphate) 3'-pyrophosphohydrolase